MAAQIQLIPSNSLLTKTPEEGRQLAVIMARLIIKITQPDASVRKLKIKNYELKICKRLTVNELQIKIVHFILFQFLREKLRPIYAQDAALLIAIGQTVAIEFATISAANNYWR